MNEAPAIIDVTLENFEQEVIARSMEIPIVLDFWAPWCAPCKTLTPMLEKLAIEYGGRFILAKVNTEEQVEIAQSFQIRSIPTVIALAKGQPVSAFQGAVPESQIRAFIDKIVPSANDERLAKARALLAAGDAAGAREDLRTVLAIDPTQDAARILLAEIAFRDNQLDEAETHLAQVRPVNQMDDAYVHMASRIAAAREAAHLPGADALITRAEANAEDYDARMQLAVLYAAQNQYEPAFQRLLEIVQRDRKWNDDAARKKMVEFFPLAQAEQPALVARYRRALASALN